MPIQFPDFQRISFDEANPLLAGMKQGQSMMQSNMMFPQDLQAKILANQIEQVKAQYAQPMAAQDLTKAQQANLWNPKIWQSEIGLRGAQAGLAGQEAKYYGPKANAEIALQQAQAGQFGAETAQKKLMLQFLQQRLGQGASPAAGGTAVAGSSGGVPSGQPSSQGGTASDTQQAAPSTNSMYGIDIPQPTADDIANKHFFGTDTFSPRQKNSSEMVMDQYKKFQDQVASSIKGAKDATDFTQLISIFNNAMDHSGYKGQSWGAQPSSGWRTLATPWHDYSNEQIADNMANQMLPKAIGQLHDAMGNARFSNLDMNAATKLKFNREMNDDTRKLQTQWIGAVNNRMQEQAKFYTLMKNPHLGITNTDADMLWQQYQQNFPLMSEDGKSVQHDNLGNWPLYTTPKAIASIKATGSYTPSANERGAVMMKLPPTKEFPQGTIVPIKKGRIEAAIKAGATTV